MGGSDRAECCPGGRASEARSGSSELDLWLEGMRRTAVCANNWTEGRKLNKCNPGLNEKPASQQTLAVFWEMPSPQDGSRCMPGTLCGAGAGFGARSHGGMAEGRRGEPVPFGPADLPPLPDVCQPPPVGQKVRGRAVPVGGGWGWGCCLERPCQSVPGPGHHWHLWSQQHRWNRHDALPHPAHSHLWKARWDS